jgi:hypothetical protein
MAYIFTIILLNCVLFPSYLSDARLLLLLHTNFTFSPTLLLSYYSLSYCSLLCLQFFFLLHSVDRQQHVCLTTL